jgi:hypothetical protein
MEQQPQPQQQQPPQPPPTGGVPGPAGRRLHIAHRRSPSELTPLMSMFQNPGSKLPLYHLPTYPSHCFIVLHLTRLPLSSSCCLGLGPS